MKKLRLGVVGATGMVGQTFMQILEQRNFSIEELRPFASENSRGKKIILQNKEWTLQTLNPNCFKDLDVVFFSSGDEISKEWAPQAAAQGAFAIDNSAAFRMSPEHLLIVPEVNGHLLNKNMKPQVIANPNCSTIQLVVALKPLQNSFGIEEVRVSSYQAVSGAGKEAYDELLNQTDAVQTNLQSKSQNGLQDIQCRQFPHPIAFNLIPQIGSFSENGFSSEEVKIIKETKKILELPDIKVSAMTVRVPVLNAHSESVWVTLKERVSRDEVLRSLNSGAGLEIIDDLNQKKYPMPIYASGQDPVYVGRIHQDMDDPKVWLMWVVADNIRKGAALNGIQIAEMLF